MAKCKACGDTGYETVELSPLQADWQICTAPGCQTAATIRARAEKYGGKKMTIVETASRAERQRQIANADDVKQLLAEGKIIRTWDDTDGHWCLAQ